MFNWSYLFQLRRLESEEGFQNDYVPGYYHQFVEDDFNFQPETITIMPTTRESDNRVTNIIFIKAEPVFVLCVCVSLWVSFILIAIKINA